MATSHPISRLIIASLARKDAILVCTGRLRLRMRPSWNSDVARTCEITTELAAAKWRPASFTFCANFCIVRFLLLTLFFARVHLLAQTSVITWHYENERTSANTSETVLTPSNVSSASFEKLTTLPVDGFVVGHPLYLAGVNVVGQGVHNVVYVATMHDSVYAFDADSANTSPLWMTSILTYSPAGATSVPATVKKDSGTTRWTEVGIISTPVIVPVTGTLYLVSETYEYGNVIHRLHALDVTSGLEKFGGPTTIAATYTLNGITTTFADLYQMNRPGLLLANGHIYIAFGSNCCNDYSQGWVLSYNATTLQQEGAYTAEPGKVLASIWQKGAGLSADGDGNIYAETSEGFYAAGTNLSISVLKLSQTGTSLALADWFTPYNYQYLSDKDLDLNDGVLILPDQPGPYPHEAVAEGKEGTIYLLDRDSMGQLCSNCTTGDTQIVQEIPQGAGRQSGTPVYWNNTVYFTGQSSPVFAYTLSNGALVNPPSAQSIKIGGGGHAIITANGNGAASPARYYLSTTTSKSGARLLTGSRAVPSLASSATSSGTVTVTVSAGTAGGTYFLLACADDTLVVPETNESNNCKASTTKTTVSGPDLTETSVTNPPATVLDGSSFSVTDSVQNIGSAAAAASTTRYYLSTTTSKSGARLLTGSRAVPSLASSATSSGTVTVTVIPCTARFRSFLLACADYTLVVPETNESNNCKASATQVTVSGPDLVETVVSNPLTTVTPGGTFSITDTVQNIGNVTAAASTTRYYLSTTTSKTTRSILLTGNRSVPSLAPAATSSSNASITVPSTLPSGTYFLLACSDDTKLVSETNETNNYKASATTNTH